MGQISAMSHCRPRDSERAIPWKIKGEIATKRKYEPEMVTKYWKSTRPTKYQCRIVIFSRYNMILSLSRSISFFFSILSLVDFIARSQTRQCCATVCIRRDHLWNFTDGHRRQKAIGHLPLSIGVVDKMCIFRNFFDFAYSIYLLNTPTMHLPTHNLQAMSNDPGNPRTFMKSILTYIPRIRLFNGLWYSEVMCRNIKVHYTAWFSR